MGRGLDCGVGDSPTPMVVLVVCDVKSDSEDTRSVWLRGRSGVFSHARLSMIEGCLVYDAGGKYTVVLRDGCTG